MEFSRQEYWNELSCPPPGDLPNSGIEPVSPALQADSVLLSHQGSPKTSTHLPKSSVLLNVLDNFNCFCSFAHDFLIPLWFHFLNNSTLTNLFVQSKDTSQVSAIISQLLRTCAASVTRSSFNFVILFCLKFRMFFEIYFPTY